MLANRCSQQHEKEPHAPRRRRRTSATRNTKARRRSGLCALCACVRCILCLPSPDPPTRQAEVIAQGDASTALCNTPRNKFTEPALIAAHWGTQLWKCEGQKICSRVILSAGAPELGRRGQLSWAPPMKHVACKQCLPHKGHCTTRWQTMPAAQKSCFNHAGRETAVPDQPTSRRPVQNCGGGIQRVLCCIPLLARAETHFDELLPKTARSSLLNDLTETREGLHIESRHPTTQLGWD